MLEKIGEKVSVITVYDREKGSVMPYKVKWQGKIYRILQLGYHHKEREGRSIVHVFDVSSSTLSFRLRFETDDLIWVLDQISDGQPS